MVAVHILLTVTAYSPGCTCLTTCFPTALPSCRVSEQFTEFEALAHRYHDYMDYEHGIRCLLELLTMGTAEVGGMGSSTARLNTALRLLP